MRAYIIRRLLAMIPVLFFVTITVFLSIRLLPGDIIQMMVQTQEFKANAPIAEIEKNIRHELGLDVPMHVQYLRWLSNIILHGDFGRSLWTGMKVTEQIANKLPVSFELGILGIITALLIAIPIGIYSGIRQDTVGDYVGRTVSILCISLPSFWLGTVVMIFPSLWWGWSPPMEYIPFASDPMANLVQFLVPGFILGMVMSGTTMRMTRTMILEVLRQDYIRTAWAKGLRERVVVTRHALKNAFIPVITIVGMQLPILIGGAVVLEQIFNLPGIGLMILNSINNRDYTSLSGINLVIAITVVLINLLVDTTYGYFDPRVQYK